MSSNLNQLRCCHYRTYHIRKLPIKRDIFICLTEHSATSSSTFRIETSRTDDVTAHSDDVVGTGAQRPPTSQSPQFERDLGPPVNSNIVMAHTKQRLGGEEAFGLEYGTTRRNS